MHNRELSAEFTLEDDDYIIDRLKVMDKSDENQKNLDGQAWAQMVARVAFGGLPSSEEEALNKLEKLEIKVRTDMAIPSKRPGGTRSKGTGFILHPKFKSYKSTLKGAYETEVEILDANGIPRSRDAISDDIKAARAGSKTPEEKFANACQTLLNLYRAASKKDTLVIGSIETVLKEFEADGFTLESFTGGAYHEEEKEAA